MLNIVFGDYKEANYIVNPKMYFDNTYEDMWMATSLAKEIVKDVDKSELKSPNVVVSPVLGSIPVTRISGGSKTLIQIAFDGEHVFNASVCGDNCAKWLLQIGREKDIVVRLGHIMHFPEETFEIKIVNTGDVVHTQYELVEKVISERLLG